MTTTTTTTPTPIVVPVRSLWRGASDDALHQMPLTCRLYDMYFDHSHNVLSARIAQNDWPANSSLGVLRRVYEAMGHTFANTRVPGRPRMAPNEPFVEAPELRYCTHYPLLAIDGTALEANVRRLVNPHFSLDAMITDYMVRFRLPAYDRCVLFPSARNDARNRREIASPTGLEYDDGTIPGLYIGDACIMPPLRPRFPNKPPRDVDKRRIRHLAPLKSEAFYPRLIPVAILPLFLDMMPETYMTYNNVLQQCMQLRDDYTRVVKRVEDMSMLAWRQVFALYHNTKVLAFWYQQARVTLRTRALVPHSERRTELMSIELDASQRRQYECHVTGHAIMQRRCQRYFTRHAKGATWSEREAEARRAEDDAYEGRTTTDDGEAGAGVPLGAGAGRRRPYQYGRGAA